MTDYELQKLLPAKICESCMDNSAVRLLNLVKSADHASLSEKRKCIPTPRVLMATKLRYWDLHLQAANVFHEAITDVINIRTKTG